MKFRSDFVTNSSSSSFALAMGEEFTDKQKDIILDFVRNHIIGKVVSVSEKEITEKDLEDWNASNGVDLDLKTMKQLQELAKKGAKIYAGKVDFEQLWGYELPYMCQDLWKELDGVDDFKMVDGDLSY